MPTRKSQPKANKTGKPTARRKTTATRTRSQRKKAGPGFLSNLIALISLTYFGHLLLVILAITLLLAINLMIAQNDFDLFYTILGIELIAVAVILWLRFLIKK